MFYSQSFSFESFLFSTIFSSLPAENAKNTKKQITGEIRKVQKKNHKFSLSKFLYSFCDTWICEQIESQFSQTFEQAR